MWLRKLRSPLKILAALSLVWGLIGLFFVVLTPTLQDTLENTIQQETGYRINGSRLGGYFYFYCLGLRLHEPKIYDEQGLIVGGKFIELELNPFKQWWAGSLSPIRIRVNGLRFELESSGQHNWSLQQRYEFQTVFGAEQQRNTDTDVSSPIKQPDQAPKESANAQRFEGDFALEELASLLGYFDGFISLENSELVVNLKQSGQTRTLSSINAYLQGGDEPGVGISILSPDVYSEHIDIQVRFYRMPKNILGLSYEILIADFSKSFLDDFFPGTVPIKEIYADIKANGSWNPLHQSHQIGFRVSELGDPDYTSTDSNLAEGEILISLGDSALEIQLPRLHYQNQQGGQSHQLLIEDIEYYDQRAGGDIQSVYFSLGRLLIEEGAVAQILKLKHRIAPETLPELDNISVDARVDGVKLRIDPVNKIINEAAGYARINYMRVEKETHFSNLEISLSAPQNSLVIDVQAVGTEVAIAGIFDTISFHSVLGGQVNLESKNDNWHVRAATKHIEMVPGQLLELDMWVEFKPGFSPWIFMNFSAQDIRTEIIQAYIPRKLLNPGLDRWLWDSLSGGGLESGYVEYGGNIYLAQPAIRPEVFSAAIVLADIDLSYHPDWPSLSAVGGSIDIRDSGMRYELKSLYRNTEIIAKGKIPVFSDPVLINEVSTQGQYEDIESFISNSPLIATTAGFFTISDINGWLSSDNDIVVQLSDQYDTRYGGEIKFSDLSFTLSGPDLSLEQLSGHLIYDQSTISSRSLSALYKGEQIFARISSVEEMNAKRTSVEILTLQKPIDILGMDPVLNSMAASGKSIWYGRYLSSGAPEPSTDDSGVLASWVQNIADQSFLFLYSDMQGVYLADHSSISKSADEQMPLVLAATNYHDNQWLSWLKVDDAIDGKIAFDFADAENFIASGRVYFSASHSVVIAQETAPKLSDEDNEVTEVSPVSEVGSDSLAESPLTQQQTAVSEIATAKATPEEVAAAQERVLARQRIKMSSILIGEDLNSIDGYQSNTVSTWQQMVRVGFDNELIEGELFVDGEIGFVTVQPWAEQVFAGKDLLSEDDSRSEPAPEQDIKKADLRSLVYRIDLDIEKLDAYGFDFRSINLDFILANDEMDLDFKSTEAELNFYYDLQRRQFARLDIKRLQYNFKSKPPPQDPDTANDQALEEDSVAQDPSATPPDSALSAQDTIATETSALKDAQGRSRTQVVVGSADSTNNQTSSTIADEVKIAESAPASELGADSNTEGLAENNASQTSAPAAESTPDQEYVIPKFHQEVYALLHSQKGIDFRCKYCQINKVSLRNIEVLTKTKGDSVHGRMRYGDSRIKEEISINTVWTKTSEKMMSEILLNAYSADVAQTTLNHGGEVVLSNREGKLEMEMNWEGSLLQLNYPTLNGTIKAKLDRGALYGVGSSSAQRLLSIINLLEIPRRFSLDFSDLGQNFEFYRANIEGNIENGIVKISPDAPLHMRSSLGKMDAAGNIDLANQRYEVGAHAIPSVVTFTAPAVALLIGGPVAGVATIALNWFLSNIGVDTNAIAEQHYVIDSSFDEFDPKTVSRSKFQKWQNLHFPPESKEPDDEVNNEGKQL